jgi:hypothetical protein
VKELNRNKKMGMRVALIFIFILTVTLTLTLFKAQGAIDPPHYNTTVGDELYCNDCHKERDEPDIPGLCMSCHSTVGRAKAKPFTRSAQSTLGQGAAGESQKGTTHRFDSEGLKYVKLWKPMNSTGKIRVAGGSMYTGDFTTQNEMEYEFEIVNPGDVGTATFKYRCRTRGKPQRDSTGSLTSPFSPLNTTVWDRDADWSGWTSAYTTAASVPLDDSLCGGNKGISLSFENGSGTPNSFDAGTKGRVYVKKLTEPSDSNMKVRVMSNKINCSVCHNQHSMQLDRPYLRVGNVGNALCKHCHDDRDRGHYILSSGTANDGTADSSIQSTGLLVDTSKDGATAWTTGQWVGKQVYFQKNFRGVRAVSENAEISLTGTLTFTQNSTTVTGSGTSFLTEIDLSDANNLPWIKISSSSKWYPISSKESNTSLTLTIPFEEAAATGSAKISNFAGFYRKITENGSNYLKWDGALNDKVSNTIKYKIVDPNNYSSHPVGIKYSAAGISDFEARFNSDINPLPLDDNGTPSDTSDDTVQCMTCHSPHFTHSIGTEGGGATSGTTTTLVDTNKSWTPNSLINHELRIRSEYRSNGVQNPNWRKRRIISSNTATEVTWVDDPNDPNDGPLPSSISAGDVYEIVNTSIDGDGYILRKSNGYDANGYIKKYMSMDDDKVICKTCHKYKNHYGEETVGGYMRSCMDCHTPHNTTNRFLLREIINNREVRLRPGDNYVNSDRTGVCQVCHTQAEHWRNNVDNGAAGSGTTAHYAEGCPQCHNHGDESRSWSSGGTLCQSCHGYPPVPLGTIVDKAGKIHTSTADADCTADNPCVAYNTLSQAIPNSTYRVEDYEGGGGAHLVHVVGALQLFECSVCHGHMGHGNEHGGSVNRKIIDRNNITFNFNLDYSFNERLETKLGYQELATPVYPKFMPDAAVADVVYGSDGKQYRCILDHTSSAGNKPVTGANWAAYWAATGITGGSDNWVNGNNYKSSSVGTSTVYVNRADTTGGYGPGKKHIGLNATTNNGNNEDATTPSILGRAVTSSDAPECYVGCHNPRRLYMQTEPESDMTDTAENSVVYGSDRKRYRALSNHTSSASNKPITGADWATYWESATEGNETWESGRIYKAYASTVFGSDRRQYRCILDHTSSASNKPVSGASWATYWEAIVIEGDDNWVSGKNYIASDRKDPLDIDPGYGNKFNWTWYFNSSGVQGGAGGLPRDENPDVPCAKCHDAQGTLVQGNEDNPTKYKGVNIKSAHPPDPAKRVDCLVCHDYDHATKPHKKGTPYLNHKDGAASIEFNVSMPSSLEPFCLSCHDNNGVTATNNDVNYNNTSKRPFTKETESSNEAPDVKSNWTGSAHSANISCFGDGVSNGCHGNPHGSGKRALLAPYNEAVGEDQKYFCFNCHGNNPDRLTLAPNIQDQIQKKDVQGQSGHPIPAAGEPWYHKRKESIIVDKRHAECIDCHDPMADVSTHRLKGQRFVDIDGNPWNPDKDTVPSNHPMWGGDSTTNYIRQPYVYEVCFRCHGPNYATFFKDYMPFPQVTKDRVGMDGHFSDKRKEFDPRSNQFADYPASGNLGANTAFHPVAVPGRNATDPLFRQLQEAFDLTSANDLKSLTIQCPDCHNNNVLGASSTGLRGPVTYSNRRSTDKTPAVVNPPNTFSSINQRQDDNRIGPHGSTNERILRAPYNTNVYYTRTARGAYGALGTGTAATQWFTLCFLCHKESIFLETDGGSAGTNFGGTGNGWWTANLHAEHLSAPTYSGSEGGQAVCHECHHNVHSNVEAQNTIYGDGLGGMLPPDSEDGILDGVSSTHLLNFAPSVQGSTALKPRWYYDGEYYRCDMYCHGANMNYCWYKHGSAGSISQWCEDD